MSERIFSFLVVTVVCVLLMTLLFMGLTDNCDFCLPSEYCVKIPDSCKPKIDVNGSCAKHEHCLIGGECSDNKICQCPIERYYAIVSGTPSCLLKITWQGSCTETKQCSSNFVCSGNKCGCRDKQYHDPTEGKCKPRKAWKDACKGTKECSAGLLCLISLSSKSCACENGGYYNSTEEKCKPKKGIYKSCAKGYECGVSGSVCSEGRCNCRTGERYKVIPKENCSPGNGFKIMNNIKGYMAITDKKKDAKSAYDDCLRLTNGRGGLAIVTKQDVGTFIKKLLIETYPGQYYMFVIEKGRPFGYDSNDPNKVCRVIDTIWNAYKLSLDRCMVASYYLCELPLPTD